MKKKALATLRSSARLRLFLTELIVPLLIFSLSTAVLVWGEPRFLVNDDSRIRSFANGTFTGTPEAELVFVGRLQGVLLKQLFLYAPTVPWYETLMLITNIASFWALGRFLRHDSIGLMSWAFLSSTIFIWLIQQPSFTTTAIVSGGIWGALIANGVLEKSRWYWILLQSLAFMWSISWRHNSIIPAVVFSTLVLLGTAVLARSAPSKALISLSLLAGISGLSYAAILHINDSCFEELESCEQWESWKDFNEIRGSLHESPRGELLKTQLRMGEISVWTSTEARQFFGWYYFSPEVHGKAKLDEIDNLIPRALLPKIEFSGDGFFESVGAVNLEVAQGVFRLKDVIGPWALVVFVLSLVRMAKSRQSLLQFTISNLLLFVGIWFLWFSAATIRLPTRVLLPIAALGAIGVVLFGHSQSDNGETRARLRRPRFESLRIRTLIFLIVFGAVVFYGFSLRSMLLGVLLLIGLAAATGKPGFLPRFKARKPLAFLLSSIILIGVGLFLPQGFLEQRDQGAVFRDHQSRVDFTEANARWGGETLFAAPLYSKAFIALPYSNSDPSSFPMVPGGWSTFSPHWYSRIENYGLAVPSVNGFSNRSILLLGTLSAAKEFASAFPGGEGLDAWRSLGAFTPDSELLVWGYCGASCPN